MVDETVIVNIKNDHLLPSEQHHQQDEIPSTGHSSSSQSITTTSEVLSNTPTINQPPEDKQATLLFEQQCCIEWRNISFPSKKPFLQNIYGFAKPGSITAICGPSSSGKSLLLRVLAMREAALSNNFDGDILLNGEVVMNSEKQLYKSTTNKYRALVSHVSKEYYAPYFNSLTVNEILQYAINLRLPMHPKHKVWTNRQERLELLLDCYRLKEVQNKFYPSLSGGEKRRLTIAIQNVFYHRVVLLEEPTDDLEFAESFLLVQSLKRVACFGVSIVMTVHKPSIREISLFDYVCLLDKGQQIYFGKIDLLSHYFSNILEIPLTVQTQNIVSNILELLLFHKILKNGNEKELQLFSEFIPHDSEQISLKKDNLAEEFKLRLDTFYKPQANEILSTYSRNKVDNIQTEKYHSNYFYTILILIERAFRLKKRNWRQDVLSPFLENLLIGFGIGLIYFQLEPTDMYYRSRVFSFLNFSISLTFGLTLKTFISQLPGMQQERKSTFYPMSAYYIARTVVNTITYSIFPLIFGLVVYFMVGLYLSVGRIFTFMFIFVVYHLTCQSFAEFLVCFFPIPYILAFMSSVLNMFTIFASGSFGKNRIFETPYTQWISYLSYVFYGFRCMMINEFAEVYYSNQTGTIPANHFTNGSYFLESVYGIEGSYSVLWIYVSCLIVIMFLCRIFAYFGLRFIIGKKSPRRFIRRVFKCCCKRAGK